MPKMTERRKDLRPREKLQTKGAAALTDHELLMAIIGSGTKKADVSKTARLVQNKIKEKGLKLVYEDVISVPSLGPAKATQLMAAYEFWRRQLIVGEKPVIDSPEKAVKQLDNIRYKNQEHFVCLTLDGANRLISNRIITIGTLTASLVHPREVFIDAISDRAASIIVAHNHPSGNLVPSEADRSVTLRLVEAGKIIGINLIDHLIVSTNGYVSVIN